MGVREVWTGVIGHCSICHLPFTFAICYLLFPIAEVALDAVADGVAAPEVDAFGLEDADLVEEARLGLALEGEDEAGDGVLVAGDAEEGEAEAGGARALDGLGGGRGAGGMGGGMGGGRDSGRPSAQSAQS